MKIGRITLRRILQQVIGLTTLLVATAAMTLGQCAMCRASIANSDDPARASSAVNAGILVLLIPTLAMIAAIAGLVFRYHRTETRRS